ncbi:MAG: DUF3597 domain-containing protein [Xanthobacteraceae bacterium]
MSIFGSIMSAIFGSAKAQTSTAPAGTGGPMAPPLNAPVPPGPTPLSDVDVAAVLTGLAAKSKEKLDWRRSIVDLMKLLSLDSGLAARKELAQELHYTGDTNDTASMNIWLHKQVMQKLAENGGKCLPI